MTVGLVLFFSKKSLVVASLPWEALEQDQGVTAGSQPLPATCIQKSLIRACLHPEGFLDLPPTTTPSLAVVCLYFSKLFPPDYPCQGHMGMSPQLQLVPRCS